MGTLTTRVERTIDGKTVSLRTELAAAYDAWKAAADDKVRDAAFRSFCAACKRK